MGVVCIVLSGRSQFERLHAVRVHLYDFSEKAKLGKRDKGTDHSGCRGQGMGEGISTRMWKTLEVMELLGVMELPVIDGGGNYTIVFVKNLQN